VRIILALALTTNVVLSGVAFDQPASAGIVHALFDLTTPAGGPFPSDRFTLPDASQNTGRILRLPEPDCAIRPSECADTRVLNTLDGFNLQPRLSITFDGPIDLATVTSETVFLLQLSGVPSRVSRVIGVDQLVWDPSTYTLYAESDRFLEQHTRYALIVTHDVRSLSGHRVHSSPAFNWFRNPVKRWRRHGRVQSSSLSPFEPNLMKYRDDLAEALRAAHRTGIVDAQIVAASVFTTQSVTAILERIRDGMTASAPVGADFGLGPEGTRTVFSLDEVTGITFNRQVTTAPTLSPAALDVSLLRIVPGAVRTIAFGKFTSPDVLVHPGEFIPPVATRTGEPVVQSWNEIYFNATLPAGPMPPGGWPIVILGHGAGQNKNIHQLSVASILAEHGLATIEINAPGRGFGRLSTLTVQRTNGPAVTFSAGGRSMDQNGDGLIDATEGGEAAAPAPGLPPSIISARDGMRQAVVDLMQLVRTIQSGMDVDDDGTTDLDAASLYYLGWSFGANYGALFVAVEPSVKAAVLFSPGGPLIDNRRLGVQRGAGGAALASRGLINAPGVTRLNAPGIAPADLNSVGAPHFDDNMPLRGGVPLTVGLADGTTRVIQSPVINMVPGALDIQKAIENMEWVSQSGNQVAYAPHFRKAPLDGVPPKSVLLLVAKGDKTVPNPTATAMIRAGDLADRTIFFRNDLAFMENPVMPKDPHGFLNNVASDLPAPVREIGRSAQRQVAIFFASDGNTIMQPEPMRFFEVPIGTSPPEDLAFIP
jgi:dienelactone hydrolase